jgi:predicted SAM-dependent methyltransferase
MRELLRQLRHDRRIAAQKRTLRALAEQRCRRIVIGSSGTAPAGWVSTDREVIDLVREDTWSRYFGSASIDAILAEHVWEHLSADDALRSAKTCYQFLKPGGYVRAAVPDGLHPDPAYIEQVRPGGTGSGAEDHKVMYNFSTFRDLFTQAGFEVRLYEYYDWKGRFQFNDWNPADGMIRRSMRFDERNVSNQLAYTSIVIDAVKPASAREADSARALRP